jgi:hypothetical protein
MKRFVVFIILFLVNNLTFRYLQPLRGGTLWHLHVHTGDERFRWCKAVLFRSQRQLTWVKAGAARLSSALTCSTATKSDACSRLITRLLGTTSETSQQGPRPSNKAAELLEASATVFPTTAGVDDAAAEVTATGAGRYDTVSSRKI